MSTLVILESDKEELKDIDNKLRADGFKTSIPVEHKLRYIWRQFTRADTSLKSSLESLEELRKQHAQEMIEVENYVSHIRQLSDEREALTQELEIENEQLKHELEQMKVEREAGAYVSDEICDMLTKSGLTQMGKRTNTTKDQINYLLQERNKLKVENEKLRKDGSVAASSKQMMKMLDEERKEMENEMEKMRETMKKVKQEERKIHEKETQELQMQKDALRAQLNQVQKQNTEDMTALIKKHEAEMMRIYEEKEEAREKSNHNLGKTERIISEFEDVKVKMKAIEREKISLQETVKSLEEEIQKEKNELNKNKADQDAMVKKLRTEIASIKQKLQETEAKYKTLESEKKTLDSRLEMAQRDLENFRQRETKLTTEKENIASEGKSASQRQQIKIQQLTDDNESLKLRLKTADATIERQIKQIETITVQLGESERALNEKEEDLEDLDKNMKNEIISLKARLQQSIEEAAELREELIMSKQTNEQLITELKEEALSYQNKLSLESNKSRNVEGDRELLRTQIVELRKDLEASLAASMSREKESMEQISALEKERDNLARELSSYISKDKDQAEKSNDLAMKVHTLETERNSMHAVIAAQERQVGELMSKLEKSDEKCADLEQSLQKELNKTAELSTKFQFTQESSTLSKQEADKLKNDLRTLSAQLMRQHDASLDSQAKYDKLIAEMRNEIEREREKFSNERQNLASQLELAMRESKDLSLLLRQREDELNGIRSELTTASQSGTKASTALEFESKMRGSLENRTAQLESELNKAWGQIKDFAEKVSSLEATKRHLEIELDKKSQLFRQAESTLQRRQAEHTALGVTRDTAQQQAEEAEMKLGVLRKEFESAVDELEKTQANLKAAVLSTAEMQIKSEENEMLREQLKEAEINRDIQQQTIQELEHQLNMLRGRDEEMQTAIEGKDDAISSLRQKLKRTSDQHKATDSEAKGMSEKVNELQQEVQTLQTELVSASEKIDYLQRKNDEVKNKAQTKIQAIKDRFAREKRSLEASVSSLQSSLELTKERMEKEKEWKGITDADQKKLLEEKRELLTKLTASEEEIREHLRKLRQSESFISIIEKENSELQDKLNTTTNEKIKLSRELDKAKSLGATPFVSPQASAHIDQQTLQNALNRLRQLETLERSFSSPSPDMYSPDQRLTPERRMTPDRTISSSGLNSSINNSQRPFVINGTINGHT